MNCRHVQDSLSEYLEGAVPPPERQAITEHLMTCIRCAQEERSLAVALETLHAIPPREPVLDIWSEMAPKIAAIQAEERLGLGARLQLRLGRFLASFAEGTILFTQALAVNTEARMRRYLLHDPFVPGEEG